MFDECKTENFLYNFALKISRDGIEPNIKDMITFLIKYTSYDKYASVDVNEYDTLFAYGEVIATIKIFNSNRHERMTPVPVIILFV